MNWLQVTVTADGEAAEVVAETLRPYAHGGVAIEQVGGTLDPHTEAESDGWEPGTPETGVFRIRIYLPGPGEPGGEGSEQARYKIEAALYHLNRIYPLPAPQFEQVSDEDWANAWKQHYSIFRVGRSLVIRPAWLDYSPAPGDRVLTLDPGMAFGTGLHPTTQLCLAALEDHLQGGERVLDMGTGSGILAIAAARLGAASVLALDVDAIAVVAARQNVAANGLETHVRVEPVGGEAENGDPGGYDVLVVNILARVIMELVEKGLIARLRPGGTLIAAGILDHQADEVGQALAAAGVRVEERRQMKDWVALVGYSS